MNISKVQSSFNLYKIESDKDIKRIKNRIFTYEYVEKLENVFFLKWIKTYSKQFKKRGLHV